MNHSVIIKGNKSGIVVVLDEKIPFEKLKQQIAKKFSEAANFLGDAVMAISFDGRKLSNEEQREILDIISENSNLRIVCIIDTDKDREAMFHKKLEERLIELDSHTGQFYKGNLRSGQVLESETSIVILGDIKPGAKVVSKGNVVVLGGLKGSVFAGASGNEKAFVVALTMHPTQIRISDLIAKVPDSPDWINSLKGTEQEAKIAFIENETICIEAFSKDVLNDISL